MEYKSENKICQNCKNDFIIEPEDFSFYEKIKVPPPTFCPECRLIHVLIWRNQRFLYKRKCSFTGESVISIYDENTEFPVYKSDIWKSDKWDPYFYSQDFDFSRSFYDQFKILSNKVPKIAINHNGVVTNSDYSNFVFDSKDVYFSSSVLNSENVLYSNVVDYSKNIMDSDNVIKLEESYECFNSQQCFNCNYVFDSRACIDSDYLFDCVNCQNCILCTNQRNKNYMILNVQYSREEFLKIKEGLDLNSFENRQVLFKKFLNLKNEAIHKYNRNRACVEVTGETAENSKNCQEVYMTYDSENIKNSIRVVKSKDVRDAYGVGPNGSFIYQGLTCSLGTVDSKFSINIIASHDIFYSQFCSNSHNLFGCIGLKNASYCIFNKQYSKEDYFVLVEKIIKHMTNNPFVDSRGRVYRYGDFFPLELSPFKYNESVAFEYRILDKTLGIARGYGWKERSQLIHKSNINPSELPDIGYPEDVKNLIVSCGGNTLLCSHAFRFSDSEIIFYKKHNLPLPRKCPMCRLFYRLELQYPYKLYDRNCMCKNNSHTNHIGNFCNFNFKTTYAPDRTEIIYCEKCYQQEVY